MKLFEEISPRLIKKVKEWSELSPLGEDKMFAQQTETNLPSLRPNVLTTSNKLDCHARPADGGNGARNDETILVPQYLSALVPSKRIAFTLAEVLLTLGIIGVVAAMTIPTLIANYQKTVTVNKLKKTVSVVEQMFQRILADNGVNSLFDTPLGEPCDMSDFNYQNCNIFISTIKKYLPTAELVYRHWDDNSVYVNLDGSHADYISGYYFRLPDGVYIQPRLYDEYSTDWDIFIDINGTKKPNMLGKDVFNFGIRKEGVVAIYSNACKKNDSWHCGLKIIKDGWQIKNDYPW